MNLWQPFCGALGLTTSTSGALGLRNEKCRAESERTLHESVVVYTVKICMSVSVYMFAGGRAGGRHWRSAPDSSDFSRTAHDSCPTSKIESVRVLRAMPRPKSNVFSQYSHAQPRTNASKT